MTSSSRHDALVRIKDAFGVLQGASAPFRARVESQLALSAPHLAAIEAIAKGATKVGDVASFTRTHVSSASRAVDALVEAGLALRDEDPSDRRAVILTLTDEGRARHEAFEQMKVELMYASLADVDDVALEQFSELLTAFGRGMAAAERRPLTPT